MKYVIYQPKDSTLVSNVKVDTNKVLYNQSDYNKVYSREDVVRDTHDNDEAILEWLFEIFNIAHPADFKGHSLSVGDIVEVENRPYFCDWVGWKKIKWSES